MDTNAVPASIATIPPLPGNGADRHSLFEPQIHFLPSKIGSKPALSLVFQGSGKLSKSANGG